MTKPLSTIYTDPSTGQTARFVYRPADSFSHLRIQAVQQVYGVCFCESQMVIVYTHRHSWILPGGTREDGESITQTLHREIKEETNMQVLAYKPVGIQTVFRKGLPLAYQLRVACKVQPFGPFISDPDGDITQIKLISPADYRKYFDWGEIGEAIVTRALGLLPSL